MNQRYVTLLHLRLGLLALVADIAVDVRVAFWQNQADLAGKAPFQFSMACDSTTIISQLQFSSLHVSFTDDHPDLLVNAGPDPDEDTSIESFLDVGLVGAEDQDTKTAALTWQPGSRIVLSGQVQSELEIEVKVRYRSTARHRCS
jgi:hypothetical protein